MVKEFYESIKVDIRDKSRNPFIGAFIFVWVIRNWEAVYTFFYFDKDVSREERIQTLNQYFVDYGLWELFVTVSLAILAIVTSYVLLNITRAIVNLFEKRVTPKILDLTGFDDVVPIQDYESTEELNLQLQKKVKELKAELAEVKLENEELEKRLLTSKPAEEQIGSVGKTLQNVANTQANFVNKKRNEALAQKIVERMSDAGLSTFLKVAGMVNKDEPIYMNVDMKTYIESGIFEPQHIDKSGEYTFYKVTDLGEIVIQYANKRKNNSVNPMDSDYLT